MPGSVTAFHESDGSATARERWISLTEIVQRCLGDLRLADKIVERFRANLDQTVHQLRTLAEQENFTELARAAHRLKGEAANVGSERLADHADCVEGAARSGIGAAVTFAVVQLNEACLDFKRHVFTFSELAERAGAPPSTRVQ